MTIDGRVVPASELGTRRAVDPGERTISVEAVGFRSKQEILRLEAGQEATLELLLEPEPEVQPMAAAPVRRANADSRASTRPDRDYTLAYAAFGVGAAGLLVGSITGALFLNQRAELRELCPTDQSCPRSTRDARDRYYLYSYTSPIAFGVGFAGAGAGLALLLSAPERPAQKAQGTLQVSPYGTLNELGVQGRF